MFILRRVYLGAPRDCRQTPALNSDSLATTELPALSRVSVHLGAGVWRLMHPCNATLNLPVMQHSSGIRRIS